MKSELGIHQITGEANEKASSCLNKSLAATSKIKCLQLH
jgi:hypothetical protein